ncbi:hypothetical protein E2562_023039 [Oryza meyeriana var. granulata]|uniref:Uncharacterized protein n=1 Tax=Oryza meyeriana var. granulata TaxID=110450 RepID=A0A6G1EYK2_9ORYZ|nr:hypothetical protein E2562_023039 [Oryza meyeriana var. granulata]
MDSGSERARRRGSRRWRQGEEVVEAGRAARALDLAAVVLGGGPLQWRRAATLMWATEGCVGRWLRCSGAPDPEAATHRGDGGRPRP